jgi:hypothetical protein
MAEQAAASDRAALFEEMAELMATTTATSGFRRGSASLRSRLGVEVGDASTASTPDDNFGPEDEDPCLGAGAGRSGGWDPCFLALGGGGEAAAGAWAVPPPCGGCDAAGGGEGRREDAAAAAAAAAAAVGANRRSPRRALELLPSNGAGGGPAQPAAGGGPECAG